MSETTSPEKEEELGFQSTPTEDFRGLTVLPKYTEREMNLYGVYEVELKSLALFNWITGMFASLAVGLWAFAIGLIIDVAKEPNAVTEPTVVEWVCKICVGLGFACIFIAGISFWWRRSTLNEIKTCSKPRQQTAMR